MIRDFQPSLIIISGGETASTPMIHYQDIQDIEVLAASSGQITVVQRSLVCICIISETFLQ